MCACWLSKLTNFVSQFCECQYLLIHWGMNLVDVYLLVAGTYKKVLKRQWQQRALYNSIATSSGFFSSGAASVQPLQNV